MLRHTICYICFLARFQPSYFLVTLLASRSFLLRHNCSIVAFSQLITGRLLTIAAASSRTTIDRPSLNYCSIVAFLQLITGRLLIIAAASSRTTIDQQFLNYCSIVAFLQLITGRLLTIAAASSRTTIDRPRLVQSPAYIYSLPVNDTLQ